MSNPMDSTEVAVEQRLVGLFSATRSLRKLSDTVEGLEVIVRPKCLNEIELVRDLLSGLLDKVGGKS